MPSTLQLSSAFEPDRVTLVVTKAAELLTLRPQAGPRCGPAMRDLNIIQDGAVAVAADRIVAVGTTDEILAQLTSASNPHEVAATGRVVSPGLVDPHTHPVYAGNRAGEFEMRIEGKSYEEIARAGGGIRATVRHTRGAAADELMMRTRSRLSRMLVCGSTTVEAKSGYGLSCESELEQLRVIRRLDQELALDLVPTFLGAHEIPDEHQSRRGTYIELLIHEMLPRVKADRLADFSDVFCDRGVYTNEETRTIQVAARAAGLGLKLHADELAPTGGAQLAAELGAVSADHLIRISDQGIRALREHQTMAVLLPGTSFSLGASRFAPGRRLVDEGVGVALATDCNAGSCNTESLPMAAALAAQYYRLTAAECWTAVTTNSAWALKRGHRIGSLAPDFAADLVLWDMEDHRELPFHFGVNLANRVVKSGRVVAAEGSLVA